MTNCVAAQVQQKRPRGVCCTKNHGPWIGGPTTLGSDTDGGQERQKSEENEGGEQCARQSKSKRHLMHPEVSFTACEVEDTLCSFLVLGQLRLRVSLFTSFHTLCNFCLEAETRGRMQKKLAAGPQLHTRYIC